MVRITRDTRLNNLNLRVQKGPTYINFDPHFLWVDYESESEEELLSEALYHKQETNKGRLSIRDIEGSEITLPEGRFLEEGEELGHDEYVVVGGQYLMQVGSIAKGARPLSNSQLQKKGKYYEI